MGFLPSQNHASHSTAPCNKNSLSQAPVSLIALIWDANSLDSHFAPGLQAPQELQMLNSADLPVTLTADFPGVDLQKLAAFCMIEFAQPSKGEPSSDFQGVDPQDLVLVAL